MPNKSIRYYGTNEPLPEKIPLRAGPFEMDFENGDLRTLRLGNQEIVRRVYVAIRDRNWGTIPPVFSNMEIRVEEKSFRVTYEAINRQGEIHFAWKGIIQGEPDGKITFSMQGEARSTFLKNRIGFCVLVPARFSGQTAMIEHSDGNQEQAAFPEDLCADQPVPPFEDMRAAAYLTSSGIRVHLHFSGDIFEMEDQRLWTDASYKIFCTPLSQPYPLEIRAGTQVAQSILISIPKIGQDEGPGDTPPMAAQASAVIHCPLPEEKEWQPLPRVGSGQASHGHPLRDHEIERLKALHLHHLRVDLPLADPALPARLSRAAQEAGYLGIKLEAALFVNPERADAELRDLRRCLDELHPPIGSWLVYPTQEEYLGGSLTELALRSARNHLESWDVSIPFAAGTNTDFIFLKRTPPPTAWMDQVCIALNPQVHAFDPLSLVETLEAQPVVVESARKLSGGLPVVVSPITFKPRFNPYASGPAPIIQPGILPLQVDPRQTSLFGAGWTLGSLRAMLAANPTSVTYYETSGWRGVMEEEGGSPLPGAFPSIAGGVYPLYHVLAGWGEFADGQGAVLASSEPNLVSGLALRLGNRLRLFIANHTSQEQWIHLDGVEGPFTSQSMDETNVDEAMRSPEEFRSRPGEILNPIHTTLQIHLQPLGVVRLDRALSFRHSSV